MNSNEPGVKDLSDLKEFELFANFLKDACGIALTPNKQYLVSTRVRKILKDHEIESLTALVKIIKASTTSGLKEEIIDAMTTNETYWFRDAYPFEYLKESILPDLVKKGGGDIRIWSAASSSGQEAYSISMAYDEFLQKHYNKVSRGLRIVGTDVSSSMINTARKGVYDKLSMARGLTSERMARFFQQETDNSWKLKDPVKARVDFKTLNLLENYGHLGRFDVIFCRNVLIYFSPDLKKEILLKLHRCLNPNGMLCLGSSEGLSGMPGLFEMVHCNPGIMYRAI